MSNLTINFMGTDINLIDVEYTPGYPARINCLPEDSYPAEPAEIEFKINTGNSLLDHLLDEYHFGEIEALALEAIEDMQQEEHDYE